MTLVLFIDMDYFYAACEEARHPEVKGKPVVVGTAPPNDKLRGVVQTCNYEARKLGIHSAMPTSQAFKLDKNLVYFGDDYKYYGEMSEKVMALLKAYGHRTEVVSIDEAALDLGEMGYDGARGQAEAIKKEIMAKFGLPCTIGISTGKIYAKMMCDESKPNGLGIIEEKDLKAFLKGKDVIRILGVGKKTADRLNAMGIDTIGKLAKADPNVLIDNFGIFGKELYQLANGIDTSRVEDKYTILSIGRERTLQKETTDMKVVESMIKELAKEAIEELNRQHLWFKGISVKAKYTDFTDKIKNKQFNNYTDSLDLLTTEGVKLIRPLITDRAVRKVGIRVSSLAKREGQKKLS
ncbi:MAG: DNA polymerase IV [Candidatus Micrarchaeota archaeon]|nr:DNA polymerase IV [Candidatus Micrarchaeota archaeon]